MAPFQIAARSGCRPRCLEPNIAPFKVRRSGAGRRESAFGPVANPPSVQLKGAMFGSVGALPVP